MAGGVVSAAGGGTDATPFTNGVERRWLASGRLDLGPLGLDLPSGVLQANRAPSLSSVGGGGRAAGGGPESTPTAGGLGQAGLLRQQPAADCWRLAGAWPGHHSGGQIWLPGRLRLAACWPPQLGGIARAWADGVERSVLANRCLDVAVVAGCGDGGSRSCGGGCMGSRRKLSSVSAGRMTVTSQAPHYLLGGIVF